MTTPRKKPKIGVKLPLHVPEVQPNDLVRKLPAFEQKFVQEYLIDTNITQAAIRAGATKAGANQIGQRCWMNVNVRRAIQLLLDERAERMKITQDRVVDELKSLAFSNVVDFVSFDNGSINIVSSKQLSREAAAAIKAVKPVPITKDGDMSVEIVLHDKLNSLKLLGQHLGMFGKGGPSIVNNTLNLNTSPKNYSQMTSEDLRKLAEKVLSSGKVAIDVSAMDEDGEEISPCGGGAINE